MKSDQASATQTSDEILEEIKEIERKKGIYKNILTFPKGTDHLKYFEKNPHPDKIPDELLVYNDLFANSSLNVSSFRRKLDFDMVSKFLEPDLSSIDKRILRMPEKLQKMIDNATDDDYITAFAHLRDCFYNYFSTPTDENTRPDIQWIEYPFAAKYPLAQKALQNLKNNLFNSKALNKLVEKLQEAEAFDNERKDFYFWNTEPYNWSDISYQSRSIQHSWDNLPIQWSRYIITPQFYALGDFTINAIPEGYVQPKKNGKYDICINKMYFFINDSFNFEDFEYLGPWNLEEESKYLLLNSNYSKKTHLLNSDFREFQRHGYGRYFPVLSKLHEVEDFEPVCKEYPFVK